MGQSVYLLFIMVLHHKVFGTIDVNLSELQYLASRLNPFECRRLVAALHYKTYDLPKSIATAQRKVDEEIPCLRQLLHWNGSPDEGKGKTHEAIVHRLRQLNRNDLADWLGKTTFKQLGKDLDRAMAKPFKELGEKDMETSYPITIEPSNQIEEEDDPWSSIYTVLMAILLGLLGTLLTLICASIIYRFKLYFQKSRYEKLKAEKVNNETRTTDKQEKSKPKYNTESSGEVSTNVQTESETDTDFG